MPVFRVMLTGQKVVVKTDGTDQVCGFVRNEYVRARTREQAIEKAKQRARERVSQNDAMSTLADSPLELTVDEVEGGISLWKLARNEGFILFEIK